MSVLRHFLPSVWHSFLKWSLLWLLHNESNMHCAEQSVEQMDQNLSCAGFCPLSVLCLLFTPAYGHYVYYMHLLSVSIRAQIYVTMHSGHNMWVLPRGYAYILGFAWHSSKPFTCTATITTNRLTRCEVLLVLFYHHYFHCFEIWPWFFKDQQVPRNLGRCGGKPEFSAFWFWWLCQGPPWILSALAHEKPAQTGHALFQFWDSLNPPFYFIWQSGGKTYFNIFNFVHFWWL